MHGINVLGALLAAVPLGRNIHGVRAVHAACMGLGRTNDKTTAVSGRASRALEVLAVLSEGGADLLVDDEQGEPVTVCEGMAELLGAGAPFSYMKNDHLPRQAREKHTGKVVKMMCLFLRGGGVREVVEEATTQAASGEAAPG
jgi:hypothetical protein